MLHRNVVSETGGYSAASLNPTLTCRHSPLTHLVRSLPSIPVQKSGQGRSRGSTYLAFPKKHSLVSLRRPQAQSSSTWQDFSETADSACFGPILGALTGAFCFTQPPNRKNAISKIIAVVILFMGINYVRPREDLNLWPQPPQGCALSN